LFLATLQSTKLLLQFDSTTTAPQRRICDSTTTAPLRRNEEYAAIEDGAVFEYVKVDKADAEAAWRFRAQYLIHKVLEESVPAAVGRHG
jgi:hypothetical protein